MILEWVTDDGEVMVTPETHTFMRTPELDLTCAIPKSQYLLHLGLMLMSLALGGEPAEDDDYAVFALGSDPKQWRIAYTEALLQLHRGTAPDPRLITDDRVYRF